MGTWNLGFGDYFNKSKSAAPPRFLWVWLHETDNSQLGSTSDNVHKVSMSFMLKRRCTVGDLVVLQKISDIKLS